MFAAFRQSAVSRINPQFFYGWVVLVVAGMAIFVSGPGQSHTFSVFVGPIGDDLGLSKSVIATAYGIATLVAAFLLPRMGKWVDQYGPRRMYVIIGLLLGISCIGFGAVSGLITLALGFGALRFLGQGSLMLNSASMVSQWFSRKRGFALSLMALGFALSMALHPPLGEWLIKAYGWRWAWVILGLMTWLLLLPLVLLFVHNKPEDVGLRPDGDAAPEDGAQAAEIDGLTLHEGLRTPAFYLLMLGWFAIAMLVTTLHFYQVSILEEIGVGRDVAARVFPISALSMVLVMPLVGRMFDRFKTRYVFAAGLIALSLALAGITWVSDLTTAMIYAVVFGITNAFSMTMFGFLMPRYFGRKHIGSLQGSGQLVAVIGASLGPLPVGLAFDYLGSPVTTLRWLAVYPIVCAVIAVLFLRTPAGVSHASHLE